MGELGDLVSFPLFSILQCYGFNAIAIVGSLSALFAGTGF
jgi:hypothetical protein